MSEHEPIEPQETRLSFTIGQHTFEFHPKENMPKIFKMGEEPHHADYFVFVSSFVNGNPQHGFVFFRELFEMHGIDMDDLTEFFKEQGVEIVRQDEPDESDIAVYEAWANGNPRLPMRLIFAQPGEEEGGETAGTEEVPKEASKELELYQPPEVPEAPELKSLGRVGEAAVAKEMEWWSYLLDNGREDLL